jgi:spermidine synthase
MAELPEYKLDQTLFDGATEREHYTVIDSRYNDRPARILYTDNQTAAQSGLPFDNNPEMLFDYNQRFIELVKGLKPTSLLIIGGGVFTLPTAIHKEFPRLQIDVFEIDGGLVNIAERFFGFSEDSHLKVNIGDGRDLLKKINKRYDLIIVDVFNSIDIPEEFNQPELPHELKAKLKTNGLVAMNIIASYHGARAVTLKKLDQAFKEVFSKIEIFPAGAAWSLWIAQNFILIAGSRVKEASKLLPYKPM